MRTASLAALAVIAYGAFLVATVPASVVAHEAEAQMHGRLRVAEAHGTLWHGAASAEVATPAGWIAIDNLAWRFQPAQLLGGRIAFAVDAHAAGLAAQGTLARSASAWHATGQAEGPAAFVASMAPLLATWRPEGRIAMRTEDFAWDDREARGDVLLEWRTAAVALSQVRPLGSYRAALHAEGARGRLEVKTLEGPLRIAGQGDVVFPSRVTFTGEARGEGPSAASLDPLLDLMGPRRPDGSRTLAWRTS